MSDYHEMKLVDGVWHCPECGRQMILEPGKLTILVEGDKLAMHRGGGLIKRVSVSESDDFDCNLWATAFE